MRKQMSKRLEALEQTTDKEIFANAFTYAIAYYLGGARNLSDFMPSLVRALGYQDLQNMCEDLADLVLKGVKELNALEMRRGLPGRAGQAQWELLTKFGFDLDDVATASGLAEARYRIVSSLPQEWRDKIRSLHRKECEYDAAVNQSLQELELLVKQGPSKHARRAIAQLIQEAPGVTLVLEP